MGFDIDAPSCPLAFSTRRVAAPLRAVVTTFGVGEAEVIDRGVLSGVGV